MPVDRKNANRTPARPRLFDNMLKMSCPYHMAPTKHTLEECTILCRFYSSVSPKENMEEPPKDKDDDPKGEVSPRLGTVP